MVTMKAKLVSVNFPADDFKTALGFYTEFFGLELGRSLTDQEEGYNVPISSDGIFATINSRHQDERGITLYFAVDDLKEALGMVEKLGGKVIVQPFDMPMSPDAVEFYQSVLKDLWVDEPVTKTLGSAAIALDPAGNAIGLIQIEPHAQVFYHLGKFATPLTREQLLVHSRGVMFTKMMNK